MVGGDESHRVIEGRGAENPSLQLLVGFLASGQWHWDGYSTGFVFLEELVGVFASGHRVCFEVVHYVVPNSVSRLPDTCMTQFPVNLHDR